MKSKYASGTSTRKKKGEWEKLRQSQFILPKAPLLKVGLNSEQDGLDSNQLDRTQINWS